MVRERFNESFERLRKQSNRLADVERAAENLDEIVEERVELDRLRHEATEARKDVVSRYEPPAPDLVEPSRGIPDTSLFGKVAATLCIVLLVVTGMVAYTFVRNVGEQFPLVVENVDESIDATAGCLWTIKATVTNNSDTAVQVERVVVVVNREFAGGRPGFFPNIEAGESAPLTATWGLGPSSSCVSTPDELSHGNIVLYLDNGEKFSTGL